MASMGGRTVFRGSLLDGGEREDLSLEPVLGRERLALPLVLVLVLAGLLPLTEAGLASEAAEEGAALSLSGLFWRVRTLESFVGRAKDCSKGLGSRSKVERFGRGGGRCWWRPLLSSEGGEGDFVRVVAVISLWLRLRDG